MGWTRVGGGGQIQKAPLDKFETQEKIKPTTNPPPPPQENPLFLTFTNNVIHTKINNALEKKEICLMGINKHNLSYLTFSGP